ncbi:alpha/beta hydrolase [Pelagicoccus mobilis]|uniref:Alpha/beta hydrolase n=1 Tax=Pelagicoccus mobilis TaxID=415221 RepID=A0A934RVE8_9BACT|nr:alpha/beta hydrolase [Pelagicoccus mobilis]MBK1876135.1 alpha/beta hydrolase [Pelagicoccus mobilis]
MPHRVLRSLLMLLACGTTYSQATPADEIIHKVEARGFIKNWIVAGPFPSPEVDEPLPDGSTHLGFYKDYLASRGGEAHNTLSLEADLTYTNEKGKAVTVSPQHVVVSENGITDLDTLFGHPDHVMAYAFCEIYSDTEQEAMISLGSDDAIKVWLNGSLVHSNYVARGLGFGQDVFKVSLKKGKNLILVKVVDMVRDWGFAIEVLDKHAAAEEQEALRQKQAKIDRLVGEEHLLWPDGLPGNPIVYDESDLIKYGSWLPDARLQISRAYSNVSTPSYYLYRASRENNTGVGVVILPGGGYNDVWIDSEGHEIALQFQEQGISSIVLKYRTNTADRTGKRPFSKEVYLPAATEDVKEAVRILRAQAEELDLDPNKIGIGGFSAGGHLSLSVLINPDETSTDSYPDFAYLIYPWLQDGYQEDISGAQDLPPLFIVNGLDDTSTPSEKTLKFYQILNEKNVPAELHIYSKGTHGFGLGRDHSAKQWTRSFEAWLKDIGMIQK